AVLLLVAAANVPRIDVAFALDTTGSMGDEIDVVKEKIVEIARNVSAGQPRPDVRFGIVAFRDRGDAYVTRAFPFSREIADGQKMHLTYTRVARATDGRKYSVLSEGGRTWVADRELDDSEWKKGGEALAKEGKVRAAAAPPAEAIMAAPAKNNLDAEIARGVRAKAEKLGVGY